MRDGADASRASLRRRWSRVLLLFLVMLPAMWLFLELGDEVHEGEPLPFDEPILLFAQGIAGEGFDQVFLFFSAIGYQYGVVPFDVALVAVLAWLRRWRDAAFAAVALGGSALLNMASKRVFARERPSLWEVVAPESTYSFPSGHAMGSMTLAMVLLLLAWPTRLRWWMLGAMAVFVPMVGLSRVYLGVHYPSDILAGWSFAVVWVLGAYLALFGREALRGALRR